MTGSGDIFGTYLNDLGGGSGRSMQDLGSLGIDRVEVLQSTLIEALGHTDSIDHIEWSDFAITEEPGRPDFTVQIDSTNPFDASMSEIVDGLVNAGVVIEGDLTLGDLLTALESAGISGFKATTNVVMSDELAQALSEAGMLEAVPEAQVVIDAGANALLKTPFKLLAELGVDQIQSLNDRVFIELGIDDPTEFAGLVSGLLEQQGEGGTLFEGSTTAGTLVVRDSAALLEAIEKAGQDLKSLGFDEVAYMDSSNSIGNTPWTVADFETAAIKIELLGKTASDVDPSKIG
jgi:hypothetical protein